MNGTSERPPTAPGAPPSGGPLSPAGHVTLAGLADYREHRLPEDVHDRLQEHLVHCDECRELAIDLGAFLDPPEEGEEVAEVDVVGGWERVRQRRAAAARRAHFVRWAAAIVVFAAFGVYGWRWVGIETRTLEAAGLRRGVPGEEVETVHLPAALELYSPVPRPFPAYRAAIVDLAGREVRAFPHLVEDGRHRIHLRLLRWALPPGDYRLELHALPDTGSAPWRYDFRIAGR